MIPRLRTLDNIFVKTFPRLPKCFTGKNMTYLTNVCVVIDRIFVIIFKQTVQIYVVTIVKTNGNSSIVANTIDSYINFNVCSSFGSVISSLIIKLLAVCITHTNLIFFGKCIFTRFYNSSKHLDVLNEQTDVFIPTVSNRKGGNTPYYPNFSS